jgi:hypothetical protein
MAWEGANMGSLRRSVPKKSGQIKIEEVLFREALGHFWWQVAAEARAKMTLEAIRAPIALSRRGRSLTASSPSAGRKRKAGVRAREAE